MIQMSGLRALCAFVLEGTPQRLVKDVKRDNMTDG